jgi:hypothetical protein
MYGLGKTLEVPGAKVPKLEKIADKPARAFGDYDFIRFSDTLQTCCQVWRFASDIMVQQSSRIGPLANHDETRSYSYPTL